MSTLLSDMRWDESHPLNFIEIRKILDARGGRLHGLRCGYVDLESVRGELTLKRFLPGTHNACAILLTTNLPGTRGMQRHWVALVRNSKGIFFFDSLKLGYPTLTKLLGSNRFVRFLKTIKAKETHKRLQADVKGIRTCGLWVATRLWQYKLSNSEFHHYITHAPSCLKPDQTVALLTMIGHV